MNNIIDDLFPPSALRFHGHVIGLVLRDCQTHRLKTIRFNPSTSPWARGDGFYNSEYLTSLGCQPMTNQNRNISPSCIRYNLDSMVEAVVIKDLTTKKHLTIRLSDLHHYPNVLQGEFYDPLELVNFDDT